MPSLCTSLVTRIPDHLELVRPKRDTSNEGGRPIARIVCDGSRVPHTYSDDLWGMRRGKRVRATLSSIGQQYFPVVG